MRLRNTARVTIADVIELHDILAGALALTTVVVFAAMIWAGNHQH